MPANLENSAGATGLEILFSFQSQRRTLPKNVNYHTILFISYASKIMLKILQARFQQYMNWEFPDVQAGFRNWRGTRDQIASIRWIMDKIRKFQEKINFCFIDYAKVFVWLTTNCGKFFKGGRYQTTLRVSWETYMKVKKKQNQTWNKWLVQNWERIW